LLNHRAGLRDVPRVRGYFARQPLLELVGSGRSQAQLDVGHGPIQPCGQSTVRRYRAWYQHTTLAMLAHAFLSVTARAGREDAPAEKGI
jgi:hypothetical protein